MTTEFFNGNLQKFWCQIFDSFPLDSVKYKSEEEVSVEGINDAIKKANEIFKTGKIRGAKQVV